MQETIKIGGSFRDPSGFVFKEKNKILRQINQTYRENYRQLMDSGLYDALISRGYMVAHKEIANPTLQGDNGFCLIEPEVVPYIGYPYEWSFSQLKDAAILTLKIQQLALNHGMSLKDASAYNVQFLGAKPVFIDTLSFEMFTQKPWIAYKQFCQHFLAPLALISYSDYRLNQLSKGYIDGIPLDLASNLLPTRSKTNLGLLMHLHMHAKSQKKYANRGADSDVKGKIAANSMSESKLSALVDHLKSTIVKLKWKLVDSEWGDYNQHTNYADYAWEEKANIVKNYVVATNISQPLIQDLGANDGKFGRIVSELASLVVCHDIDETAVEKNYLNAKAENNTRILPLIQNLTNPSPATGWANEERYNLGQRGPVDISMALALVHHIALSNNVPLEQIAAYLCRLSQYLIIEFVSKEDSQVQVLLSTREDIFPNYTLDGFIEAFTPFFTIIDSQPIQDTDRTMFLMKSQSITVNKSGSA